MQLRLHAVDFVDPSDLQEALNVHAQCSLLCVVTVGVFQSLIIHCLASLSIDVLNLQQAQCMDRACYSPEQSATARGEACRLRHQQAPIEWPGLSMGARDGPLFRRPGRTSNHHLVCDGEHGTDRVIVLAGGHRVPPRCLDAV